MFHPVRRKQNSALVYGLVFIFLAVQWLTIRHYESKSLPILSSSKAESKSLTSPLLVVVVSIGKPYKGIGAQSVIAYCLRHGYRLHVQNDWIGDVAMPPDPRAAMTQKLLACTHAKGEKYVLVLDDDIVIGPWTPPIHLEAEKDGLGTKVGIVDEDTPTAELRDKVFEWKLGIPTYTMEDYYGILGEKFNPPHGMLNTGVVLVQPEPHCQWMKDIYYNKSAREYFSKPSDHYDQPVLGAALIRTGNYKLMHHAWNRGWVYYKDAKNVGGRNYTFMDLWKKSYFMHFYWDKEWIHHLDKYLDFINFTFDPQQYAAQLEP